MLIWQGMTTLPEARSRPRKVTIGRHLNLLYTHPLSFVLCKQRELRLHDPSS
jgi:hypothetical protein